MSDDSTTECLLFPEIFLKPVVAQFDQREGSSDGGALLLKALQTRFSHRFFLRGRMPFLEHHSQRLGYGRVELVTTLRPRMTFGV
jgi:hypothetical protein